jgi:hypothetical protein
MYRRRLVGMGVIFGCLLGLNGCQSPRPILTRGVVLNNTSEEIENVTVLHLPTNKRVSVTKILPGRTLDIGISPQPLMGDSAVVSWQESDGEREVKLDLPIFPKPDAVHVVLVYEIEPQGKVRAYFLEVNKN